MISIVDLNPLCDMESIRKDAEMWFISSENNKERHEDFMWKLRCIAYPFLKDIMGSKEIIDHSLIPYLGSPKIYKELMGAIKPFAIINLLETISVTISEGHGFKDKIIELPEASMLILDILTNFTVTGNNLLMLIVLDNIDSEIRKDRVKEYEMKHIKPTSYMKRILIGYDD